MRRNTICLLNINMQDLTILLLDLKVRGRTGGWSDFFASVFPLTEDQHRRRPVSTPVAVKKEDSVVKGYPSHQKMVEE